MAVAEQAFAKGSAAVLGAGQAAQTADDAGDAIDAFAGAGQEPADVVADIGQVDFFRELSLNHPADIAAVGRGGRLAELAGHGGERSALL